MEKVIVIGAGFAGLSAAACLAAKGLDVTILEKNATPGGRARMFRERGFTFDMGPSWYWMPDVFEKFFARFGKTTGDYYQLLRLDPSYRVHFGKDDFLDMPAQLDNLYRLFESLEPGSSNSLRKFLAEGAAKYSIGMGKMVHQPRITWRHLCDINFLYQASKMNIFESHASYVRRFFRNPRLISILEFPVLFLGATAQHIPALYSLMNYADMALGTWYPEGGMFRVVDAMVKTAVEQGATLRLGTPVDRLLIDNGRATGVQAGEQIFNADFVVGAADYHHIDRDLVEPSARNYSDPYWESRTLAPSCLIFFVGVNKRVKNLLHHNLFFDVDGEAHVRDIYESPRWPDAPRFYVSCPSKTDPTVAPNSCENLFILVPVAPGMEDVQAIRDHYFSLVMRRMETVLGESLIRHVMFLRSYAHNDFISDYNAFKGNAYGLANTLRQTANLKPRIRSRKVSNLFFAGQLTSPGPGVPPAIISGQVAAQSLLSQYGKQLSPLQSAEDKSATGAIFSPNR